MPTTMQPWLAPVIAAIALGFTLFSFWWMNWRPGSLQVGDFEHFAVGKTTTDDVNIVTLPVILYNTGARPVVLESLRLVHAANGPLGTLLYEAVDTPLWTMDAIQERDYFFLPTCLKANEVIKQNFVFQHKESPYRYEHILYHLHLEAKVSGRRDWFKVKDVELDFRDKERFSLYYLNEGYRAYRFPSQVSVSNSR